MYYVMREATLAITRINVIFPYKATDLLLNHNQCRQRAAITSSSRANGDDSSLHKTASACIANRGNADQFFLPALPPAHVSPNV